MKWELLFFLAVLGACLIWILMVTQKRIHVESYLVANRGVDLWTGGLSTGAGWIHAPAVLVSGLFAYRSQMHFAMFFIPNVAALLLQAWIAPYIRQKMQEKNERWYTMAQALGGIFGPRVRSMMFVATALALSLAVAYTFVGVRQWVERITTYQAHEIAIAIAVFSFLFVIFRGLPAAIVSDKIKMLVIGLGILGTLVIFAMVTTGQVKTVGPVLKAPLGHIEWYVVMWSVGLPFMASLLGGPMCNPDLPERLLAIQDRAVRLAYMQGAGYFALATAVFGTFGYMARELGIALPQGAVPIVLVLQHVLPEWAMIIPTVAVLVIFAMALASLLASAGDVISIEVMQRWVHRKATEPQIIAWSRASMLVVIVIGAYITSFKSIDVAFLQESMAVVRGEAIFPVIFAAVAMSGAVDSRHVFWGMVFGFVGGFVLFLGWFSMDAGLAKAFPTIASIGSPIGQLPLIAQHGKSMAALWAIVAPLAFCIAGYYAQKNRADVLARYPS